MAIPLVQIIVSVLLVILILLQERSSGLSGLLGGGEGGFYHARRGMERMIFAATILLACVFVALAIYQLLR